MAMWNLPDITPDILNEINQETRVHHLFEATIVTGVDNSETSQQDSLLVIHGKCHSLLRKLLCISVYILRLHLNTSIFLKW